MECDPELPNNNHADYRLLLYNSLGRDQKHINQVTVGK